jgi:hypothetical protein
MDHRIGTLMEMIDQQNETLAKVIDERDALRAEITNLANWIQCDDNALMTLQKIYRDPTVHQSLRARSAASALGWELAKPPSVSLNFNIGEELKQARMKVMEDIRLHGPRPRPPCPTNGKPPPFIDHDDTDQDDPDAA